MPIATSRTIDVLEALAASTNPLTLTEIVTLTGIGRASAGRLLAPMIESGAVIAEGDPAKYRLGLRMWGVGLGSMRQHIVVSLALPHLLELASSLNTRINLAIPEGDELIYVMSIDFQGPRLTVLPVYIRTPMLANASGRIVAAFADQAQIDRLAKIELPKLTSRTRTAAQVVKEFDAVRAAGYATIDREREEDISGLAVPLRDRQGAAVGAIGLPLMGPLREEFVTTSLPKALDAAARISAELGFQTRSQVVLA